MQRTSFCCLLFVLFATVHARAQSFTEAAYITTSYRTINDTAAQQSADANLVTLPQLMAVLAVNERTSGVIGFTKAQRPINVYYFPGRSSKRALVIGGVHGTELSSIEVAYQLIKGLAAGDTPFYSVLIIPSMFPDNAVQAGQQGAEIGSTKNIGRYSTTQAADPNRQMPALGKAYDAAANADALGRTIEYENGLLLRLIQEYKPQRIVNIHAIRDTAQAGIFADPRTDAQGFAFEFQSDSSLAVRMAQHIVHQGGVAPGNHLGIRPTALYYKDPPVAAPGQLQRRSCQGSVLPQNRGHGVSLGSWASTAVHDSAHTTYNREAIRLLTMEFPGYKRPIDYDEPQQAYYKKQVSLYATSIQHIFLEQQFVEAEAKAEH